MPAFLKHKENYWKSTPRAMGPFKGLQGGGVAGLMVFELEQMAAEQTFGLAVSASIEFLLPTQPGELRTMPKVIRRGRRVSVLSNEIVQGSACTARATVCFIHPTDIASVKPPAAQKSQPGDLAPIPPKKAIHGAPWMMDNFVVRPSDTGVIWFNYLDEIVEGMTPMAGVLGPADWTHGIGRPSSPQLADPNINLNVILSRHPVGKFIGILPKTVWMPTGIGMGEGTLSDEEGDFGKVMMSVALTTFG